MSCAIPWVKLENTPFKICLSSLCSKYFLFLLPHLVHNLQQWEWGGRSSTAAEANHFCSSDSCSHPPCADPKARGSTAPLFGRQGFRCSREVLLRPQRYLSSLQVYTHKIKNDLSALLKSCTCVKSNAFVFLYWCFHLFSLWLYWLQVAFEFVKCG